jgi:hypothetical protein
MRRARRFLSYLAVQFLLLLALLGHGRWQAARAARAELPGLRAVVSRLGLTDVALWTEARYTRNPSQADFFSPFQDFPASLDHFPAGSILAPPRLMAAPVTVPPETAR